jgi:hypothetical protein
MDDVTLWLITACAVLMAATGFRRLALRSRKPTSHSLASGSILPYFVMVPVVGIRWLYILGDASRNRLLQSSASWLSVVYAVGCLAWLVIHLRRWNGRRRAAARHCDN